MPVWLGLAPAVSSGDRLIYSVESRGGPELDPPEPITVRLTAFDPTTLLLPAAVYPVDGLPAHLAFAPAGDTVYALESYDVVTVDLRSGQTRLLARLPERGLALTVDAERVYVATAYGSTVETVDVASGKRGRPLPVGRGPVAVVSQVF
jgi:DNA-binding beta-propeller fold protein YncE